MKKTRNCANVAVLPVPLSQIDVVEERPRPRLGSAYSILFSQTSMQRRKG